MFGSSRAENSFRRPSFCAVAFMSVVVTIVDVLSDSLFQAANTSVDDAIRRIINVQQLGAVYGLGWGVPSLVAFGCAIGAFMYWCVMVARKVDVLILVSLAVFAGAGGGWEVAKRWRRGWIEATATLVGSKLLMTVVFLIGVSAMGKADSQDGMAALSDALAGLVVMILVLLCPTRRTSSFTGPATAAATTICTAPPPHSRPAPPARVSGTRRRFPPPLPPELLAGPSTRVSRSPGTADSSSLRSRPHGCCWYSGMFERDECPALGVMR